MSDLKLVLKIPVVFGDNAVEIEKQIKDLAVDFFGSDVKLALPTSYTAKPVSKSYAFNNKKAYEVRDLTVERRLPHHWDSLQRKLDLPEISAANAAGILEEIDRLVCKFFGPDHEPELYGQAGVLKASAPEDGEPRSGGKRVYRVQHVVAQEEGGWSTD